MNTSRQQVVKLLCCLAAIGAVSGCALIDKDAHLAAFSTTMTGMNEVPLVATNGTGRVDAVLNKETRLFRWKVSYQGLTGAATAGHFHGPAAIGGNAGVALAWRNPMTSPMEGSATLTAAQADELLAGRWYANIHTSVHPGGEIRGQMILRK
jgi:CHRD domain